MWTPDSELRQLALETIQLECEALTTAPEPSTASVLTLLEGLGTLAAMSCADDAKGLIPPPLIARSRDILGALELPELDDASVVLLEQAPLCLTMDESLLDEELQPVLDALRTRDRAQLLWLGAEALGIVGAFSDDAVAARDAFDECLRPELWQLVPLGTRRTTEFAWIDPARTLQFWWRTRGAKLSADALADPAAEVAVLRAFSEARAHLEALAQTRPIVESRVGSAVASVASLAPPSALRAAFALRRAASDGLRAAASSTTAEATEIPLLRSSAVDLGFAGSTLIADLRASLRPGAIPTLRNGTLRLSGIPAPELVQRFTFALEEASLALEGWVLEVPLATGNIEVVLDDLGAD